MNIPKYKAAGTSVGAIRTNTASIDECVSRLRSLRSESSMHDALTKISGSEPQTSQGDYVEACKGLDDGFGLVKTNIELLLDNTIHLMSNASAYFTAADSL